ncbi:MAG: HipA domain-containing protein, partial [Solirubrobacteraceae bacterium]
MPDGPAPLAVWCFDRRAGTLTQTPSGIEFAYTAKWVATGMPPLSQSLPLDGRFDAATAAAFFGGLLPEGEPRRQLVRILGVSEGNDYSMLAITAGDTAGAITLLPEGERPEPTAGDVEWLDEADLVELLIDLPSRPMHGDADGEYRLALAGAQHKLPVVVDDNGRIGLTRGQTPSTHIIKTPIERLAHTVVNEAFCPRVGRQLGVEVVDASAQRVAGHEFLLVKRYDRRESGDGIARLHQEDFCQALGVPTARKYQAEGGPSLADCFALVRRASAVPARDVIKLLDDVALNFLVGNHDAHGKNFSLLYLPASQHAVLAPEYDVLSTFAYRKTHNLTRKMAMSIGGEYRPEYVRARHLDRLFDEAGLGAAAARRRLRAMARDAPDAARNAREQLIETGWDAPILATIVELIDERARWLLDVT